MKYNAMMDVAFTVETEHKDWTKIPYDVLLDGLQQRLNELRREGEGNLDAFGFCDQYEIEEA